MKRILILAPLLFTAPAWAADTPPSEVVQMPARPDKLAPSETRAPDPSQSVTLTLGELQLLIAANVAQAQAQTAANSAKPVMERLQKQIGEGR